MVDNGPSHGEWRLGWTLVMASTAGMSLSPLLTYPLGLFVIPLEQELGWNRTLITSGLTVNAIVAVLLSAFVGALIDRIGPRRIAIPGVILFCLFFGSLSTVSGPAWHWWLLWFGLALSGLMVNPTVWAKAIASRFDKSRGLALAIMLSGTGLTGIISPPLAGYLIDNHGWRSAYIGIAAVYLAMILPLILLFFYGATDQQRTRSEKTPVAALTGPSVKEAMALLTFWKLAFAVLLAVLVVTGGLVHFVPIVTEAGIDRASAVALTSVIGISAVSGRLLTGFLLDRVNAKIIGGIAFVLPGLSMAALALFGGTIEIVAVVTIFFGLAMGAEFEIAAYLTSCYFGLRNFGALFGFITGFASLGIGLGAPLAGAGYDRFGSYDMALWIAVGIGLISSVFILSLPSYARPPVAPPH